METPEAVKEWQQLEADNDAVEQLRNNKAFKAMISMMDERIEELSRELINDGIEYKDDRECALRYEQVRNKINGYRMAKTMFTEMNAEIIDKMEAYKAIEKEHFQPRQLRSEVDYTVGK